jgi:predicted TIM-barrel enzyme
MISRELIQSLDFRAFTKTDYYGFSGVSSPIPLIAENDDEGILMIIDGDAAELYAVTSDGGFDCVDCVENIRDLPYKTEKQIRIEAEIAAMEKSIAALKAELN